MRQIQLAAVGFGAVWLALSPFFAGSALAQAAQLTTDTGPHYVGEAVGIRVTAVGFEEEPAPTVMVSPAENGTLELVGVSPSVSQSITIRNGQMSRTRDVTHIFQFRYVASEAGAAIVGPFRLKQGTREVPVSAARLTIQAVPSRADLRVELLLPSRPLVVGERVPVTVSFTLEESLRENILEYNLRVPLFDEPAFRFLDEGHPGDMQIAIETQSGRIDLRGQTRKYSQGNKRYSTISVTRTLVPLVPGRYVIPPTSLSVEEGAAFRRNIFQGRTATKVRSWRAEDPGGSLDVEEIPGSERPPSFGGGIGRGFSLDVSADRTVVQVGDPITLTLLVRGEGLETASLPPLDAEGLLSSENFRVLGDVPTGEIEADVKRFTAVVRVLSDEVREVPALAYSWFDADSRKYQTAHSRPIALSVRSAEVIGARDVEAAGTDSEMAAREADATPRARSFALTGADLAIERDPSVVLAGAAVWGVVWLPRALYAGSALLLLAAVWDRRRRQHDPALARRAQVLAESLARVKRASRVGEVGQAIRQMLRERPEALTDEIDAFLGECDARSYAPSGSGPGLDAELLEQAIQFAEGLAAADR